MHNYFICKVSYEKTIENGKQKKVTEPYLVDALSFTEAEARIITEMKPYISGDFVIADISRYPLSETFFSGDGDRYFKATVNFITIEDKSGSEKKTKSYMLILANDLQKAKDKLTEGMKDSLTDWELPKIEETQIMDVFIHS